MKYFEKIDGLRFFAILFVLIEHFAPDLGHVISAGYYGVDLFFVISGFLITNILLRPDGSFLKSYKNFVGRRTLRIFPIYYLTIFILVVLGYEPAGYYLFYFITYTFNYAWIYLDIPANSLSHFWSLAVEEQFYLLWPFLILPLRKHIKVLFVIISVLVIVSFFQLSTRILEDVNPYNYVGLFPRAGSLCIGALGAIVFFERKLPDSLFNSKVLELLIFVLLVFSLTTQYVIREFVLALCSLYLVLKSVHSDFNLAFLNRVFSNKRLVFVGKISYGIYVYHLPVAYYLLTYLVNPLWNDIDFHALGSFSFVESYQWVILFPVFSAISIFIAYLSNRYVEKPILQLKDRYF